MDSLRKRISPTSHLSKSIPPRKYSPPKSTSEPKNKVFQNQTAEKDFYGQKISEGLFVKSKPPIKNKLTKLKIFKKILLSFLTILLISIFIFSAYFIYKLNNFGNKILPENQSADSSHPLFETLTDITKIAIDERTPLKGEQENRINILLLGIAGEGKPGGNLTDTIMIASIDTKKNKIALLSLPRDLYAQVPETNYSAKINSLYKHGLTLNQGVLPLKRTIENITQLSINYYLIVNFSGFEKFIDDIGGINIEVERDIYDPTYPGPNYSYETFEIKKGFHKLDGATALKYARERHNDPEGDFGRAKRQQQVIQSAKNKLFSTKTLLNPFAVGKILDTLGENIKTDLTIEEIDSLIKLTKNLDTQNINNAVVDAWKEESLLKVSHIFYENVRAFVLVPRIGNYSEIQDLAKNIFDLEVLEKRKKDIQNEEARIALIDNTGNNSTYLKVAKLLEKKLGFKNIQKLSVVNDFSSSETIIFDLSAGKNPFTLDELIKKVPATLNNDTSSLSIKLKEDIIKYDLLVILSKDLNDIYHYEENTLEELEKYQATEEELIIKK